MTDAPAGDADGTGPGTTEPDLWRGHVVIGRSASRICVLDPGDPGRCLKFELPPEEQGRTTWRNSLRRRIGRALPYFGYTSAEWRAYCSLRRRLGPVLHRHVAECFGLLWTPEGVALWSRRIVNEDGTPARRLHHWLTVERRYRADTLLEAVDRLEAFLLEHSIPLFDLNTYNLLVCEDAHGQVRLVSADIKSVALGKKLLPLSRWFPVLMRHKLHRRAARLRCRIREAPAPADG
ncbi:YrbL family protein [Thioalkalivibrio thiocyanodenitrificans]|uniref:YrbL family protein n=1 Tax=Thioalkalivibrio thiocyanodenitrificans TaxID=243063 RepID=UPI0003769F02|nr:YrbL family protein [Thioalkalivibrio thiocyanodenitrificans]